MNNLKSWIPLRNTWENLMLAAIILSVVSFFILIAFSLPVPYELYLFSILIVLPIYMLAIKVDIGEKQNIIRQELYNNYRQIESLLAIHSLIKFEAICPAFRGWPVSPDFAYLAIKTTLNISSNKPDFLILECGSGSSTIVLGALLKKIGKGRLISLESDILWYKETLSNLQDHNLNNYVKLIHAPLKNILIYNCSYIWYEVENLPKEAKIDFLIVDGPRGDICKLARFPVVPILKDYLSQDCVILIDDAKRDDEILIIHTWQEMNLAKDVQFFDTEAGAAIMKLS